MWLLDAVQQPQVQQPFTYAKPEAASAVLGSWWWAVCRPKHVELHINTENKFWYTVASCWIFFCMNCFVFIVLLLEGYIQFFQNSEYVSTRHNFTSYSRLLIHSVLQVNHISCHFLHKWFTILNLSYLIGPRHFSSTK